MWWENWLIWSVRKRRHTEVNYKLIRQWNWNTGYLCSVLYCHSWHYSSHCKYYAGGYTCVHTRDLVEWDGAPPAYTSLMGGLCTWVHTHTHTCCSHIIFHVTGHLIVDMGYHNMTRWSELFYKVTSQHVRRSAACVWVCSCAHVHLCLFPCPHFHTCQHTKATWESIESCSSCGICYSNGVWLFAFANACVCHGVNMCMCECVISSAWRNKRHSCVSAGSL